MYRLNFIIINENNFSLTELENMLPWEREIYTALIQNKLREDAKRG
jgi:hypothetical protein